LYLISSCWVFLITFLFLQTNWYSLLFLFFPSIFRFFLLGGFFSFSNSFFQFFGGFLFFCLQGFQIFSCLNLQKSVLLFRDCEKIFYLYFEVGNTYRAFQTFSTDSLLISHNSTLICAVRHNHNIYQIENMSCSSAAPIFHVEIFHWVSKCSLNRASLVRHFFPNGIADIWGRMELKSCILQVKSNTISWISFNFSRTIHLVITEDELSYISSVRENWCYNWIIKQIISRYSRVPRS